MSESGAWEVLPDLINHQLTKRGVLVKQGAIVDATVTPTPRKPKGKTSYTMQPEGQAPIQRSLQSGVDQEARWVKRGGQLQ